MSERKLPRFIMCFCTGECPGFAKLELWKLINFVRNELDVEYAIIHPQLCVTDGDNFLCIRGSHPPMINILSLSVSFK
jgi:hypothetical protein